MLNAWGPLHADCLPALLGDDALGWSAAGCVTQLIHVDTVIKASIRASLAYWKVIWIGEKRRGLQGMGHSHLGLR